METKRTQLYNELKSRIKVGEYPKGMKLPKEIDFATQLGVGRKTLRHALSKLEEENLIVRLRSKGTFVQNDIKGTKKMLLILGGEIDDETNPKCLSLLGVQQACNEHNISLEVSFIDSFCDMQLEKSKKLLIEKNFDAIILYANHFNGDEKILSIFENINIPIILPHSYLSDYNKTPFSVITINYEKAIFDGLSYLKSKGHRNIAIVNLKNAIRAKDEFYINAIKKLDISNEYIIQIDKITNVENCLENYFLNKTIKPTAFFCYSDYFAKGIYKFLGKNNLQVGKDISVLAMGGNHDTFYVTPTLSTVDFVYKKIGYQSVIFALELCAIKQTKKYSLCRTR